MGDLRYPVDEIENLRSKGIEVDDNLKVSDQVHLIFPYHKEIDRISERRKKIGTTGRGIGPCYVDKVGRSGIRLADLLDDELFKKKLKENIEAKNETLQKLYGHSGFSFDEIYNQFVEYRKKIAKYACNTTIILNEAVKKGKRLLSMELVNNG